MAVDEPAGPVSPAPGTDGKASTGSHRARFPLIRAGRATQLPAPRRSSFAGYSMAGPGHVRSICGGAGGGGGGGAGGEQGLPVGRICEAPARHLRARARVHTAPTCGCRPGPAPGLNPSLPLFGPSMHVSQRAPPLPVRVRGRRRPARRYGSAQPSRATGGARGSTRRPR